MRWDRELSLSTLSHSTVKDLSLQKLGIVIPSYNEAESIAALLETLLKVLPEAQIVVVDDSPTLETVQNIEELKLGQVRVIHRTQKGGRGSAVITGLQELLKLDLHYFLEMDADFSHPPREIPELVKDLVNRKLDMLIGSRYLNESSILNWPLSRRVFSKLSNLLARFVLQVPIHDYTNGFRCYSRKAAEHIGQNCGKIGFGFIALSEILVSLYFTGFSIGERPTVFVNRVRGESSLNFKEIKNALVGLAKIYFFKRKLVRENYGILEKSTSR